MELLTLIFTDKKVIKDIEMPSTEAYAEAEMDRIIENQKDYKQILLHKRPGFTKE